ncbi:TolC family protein [Rhizobacter sp. Root1221]|uniref:TolC family protein n=1 Tax=Rhizobacter sp. Root1221 TaxID=1736433 RepID=UPI0009ECBD98|nr:TolC family protein [Rhizobacter sp. Root1221]
MLSTLLGCATPPSLPARSFDLPAQWSGGKAAADAPTQRTDAWWTDFGSTELDALVESALQANRDLRVAAARVAQARALADGSDADRLPQLGLVAGATRGRDSGADPKADVAYAGFRASWELDVFSGKALASAASAHDAQGAELAQQAARIALAAEVATAYVELQALARREVVAGEGVAALERQIAVARRRFDAGQLGSLDIDRYTSELRQEKANAAQLHGALQVRQRQLAVLVGAVQVPAGAPWAGWGNDGVAAPAAPLPAELLERRPDVKRGALAVEAAAARVGVAKTDLYPRIQIDWAGRKERLRVQGGDAATTLVVGYGVSLSLPIFDGGRIRANIAIHEARAQEAMAEYEKAMLGALADVEVAFTQLNTSEASVAELEQAMIASTDAAAKSERLFQAGLTDLNTVLDVRRSRLRAQDALLQARGARWVAAVSIRRAFAGAV